MEKILYITVDTKPENESVSKTIGREFVNKLLGKSEKRLYGGTTADLLMNPALAGLKSKVIDSVSRAKDDVLINSAKRLRTLTDTVPMLPENIYKPGLLINDMLSQLKNSAINDSLDILIVDK